MKERTTPALAHKKMTAGSLGESLVNWARSRDDIAGIVLVGSRARDTAKLDSDFDFVILTDRPAAYASESKWVEGFGTVRSKVTEEWGAVTSMRAFYASGDEAEFGLAAPEWAALPLDPGTQAVISNGFKILYDPRGILRRLEESLERSGWD